MYPSEFIQKILIEELNVMQNCHPYLAFSLILTGIEFLGKCSLDDCDNWHHWYRESDAFLEGCKLMHEIDSRYNSDVLKKVMRNGFAHAMQPDSGVLLSQVKHGALHLEKDQLGNDIYVIEIFFRDFTIACRDILSRQFPSTSKMKKPFIRIS